MMMMMTTMKMLTMQEYDASMEGDLKDMVVGGVEEDEVDKGRWLGVLGILNRLLKIIF